MQITLTADQFSVLFQHATAKPLTPEARQELTAVVASVADRHFPEHAAAALKAWQDASIALIEKGLEPSEESKQLYRNIVATFGKNATGEDLVRFGNAMIKKSNDDPKN